MSSPPHALPRWKLWGAIVLVAGVALVPWFRNHGFLRDFYDYGLVMAATARIDAGERPYADFATPIQAGFFALHWVAEKTLGGNFQALTRGAALGTGLAAALLVTLLARRFSPWLAALAGVAVLGGSMSQHTILWHNSLGVGALAAVAWSAALAPVWRRDTAWLHAATALGLFLGGINKLNFQLVALAAATGWTLHAHCSGRANARDVARTLAALLLCGLVLPITVELAWTGASPAAWWRDVVHLAAGSRAAYLASLLTPRFYLEPLHNYYGPLLLPAAGLAGVLTVLLATLGVARRSAAFASSSGKLSVALAALGALTAGALLLATNHEIAYVALAASLVLAVALWLGFDAPVRGAWPAFCLGLPALVIGGASWISAWQGQRSQFGTQSDDRAAYREVAVAPAMNRYLRGTRVPADFAASLSLLPARLPAAGAGGRHAVFYGPGCEWLEHVWPAVQRPRAPLWFHGGTSYDAPAIAALTGAFAPGGPYEAAWVPVPWNYWPPECAAALQLHFEADEIGAALVEYRRLRRPGAFRDAVEFNNTFGGNANARLLATWAHPLAPEKSADGRGFLGVRRDRGELDCDARAYRLRVEAVLQRLAPDDGTTLRAEFAVTTQDDAPHVFWSQTLELPAGQTTATIDHTFDAGAQPVRLHAIVPPESAGRVAAGWRGPYLQHAKPDDTAPPRVRPRVLPDSATTPAIRAALVRCDWQPNEVVVRGVEPLADGLHVAAGGEAWVRADSPVTEWHGTAQLAADAPPGARPTVRVVFRAGDRFEILQQFSLSSETPRADFRGWLPQGSGWFGVLVDPRSGPVVLRITQVKPGG